MHFEDGNAPYMRSTQEGFNCVDYQFREAVLESNPLSPPFGDRPIVGHGR
jgi:hypothetical protein